MTRTIRLLLIGTSHSAFEGALRELRDCGYDPQHERVDTESGLAQALERSWDAVLACHCAAAFCGEQALRVLKDGQCDIPLIIVSESLDPSSAASAIRAGARDFIYAQDLARLVPALEREMQEARLRREKRHLEYSLVRAQKLDSVGRLAGGIAHDFNNLLTAVLAYACLLTPDNPTYKEDVEEIKKAAQRGASLCRQLLAFSREEAVSPRILDLNAEVSDMDKLLRRTIPEGTRLVTLLSPELSNVKADVGQIQQILVNLVVNARDALRGEGRITVRTENIRLGDGNDLGAPAGVYVRLSVADTGPGIDDRIKARLFEPFVTTKEPGKGTGLGLSIVNGIVKQNGGYISVESRRGLGATFSIYFPTAAGKAQGLPGGESSGQSYAGTETILVVDDDQAIVDLLRRALGQKGYEVLTANSGFDALYAAGTHRGPLHLLLADMVLPDMNGIDLANRLSARRPEARALFVSGHLDQEFPRFALEAGVPFLQKPFTLDALLKKLREALEADLSGAEGFGKKLLCPPAFQCFVPRPDLS